MKMTKTLLAILVLAMAAPVLAQTQEKPQAPARTEEGTAAPAPPQAKPAPKLGHPLDPADVDVLTGKANRTTGANRPVEVLPYGYGGYAGYGWRRFPSYAELMAETDGQGGQQSYLATESRYQALRRLHLDNRIVPVVGDFAGDRALRAVGGYLRDHGLVVRVFYTSNVEQYLFRGDGWRRFFANVATLPVDERSTFVRAFFNSGYRYQSQDRRSATLLGPIDALVTAVRDGRVRFYGDVIAMSTDPTPVGR